MAFARSLFSNLFGKADNVESDAGGPARQSPQAGHSDIAFKWDSFVQLIINFWTARCPLLIHTCWGACSESNSDEAKLAWLWREYEHSAQSDVKVLFCCKALIVGDNALSNVVFFCSTQKQPWTSF